MGDRSSMELCMQGMQQYMEMEQGMMQQMMEYQTEQNQRETP